MSQLVVVGVTVKDVLGANEFRMEPGKRITLLRGKNATGKSSALRAVQQALEGGNLAKLARVGKPGEDVEPEVVLIIEGPGTEAYRVERKGASVKVKARVRDTAAFEDVGKPQTWLRSLYDPVGANPVAFLMAKDDDRATMLLEALHLPYSREALIQAMGLTAEELASLPPIPAGLHPLEEMALIREGVFRRRTGVNRDHDGKAKAAEETRLNAPAQLPTDPSNDELATLDGQALQLAQAVATQESEAESAHAAARRAAAQAFTTVEGQLKVELRSQVTELYNEHERAAAAIRAEAEARIAAAAEEMGKRVEELRGQHDAELDKANVLQKEALTAATTVVEAARAAVAQRRQELAGIREELAALRARRESSAKARAMLELAAKFDGEAASLKEEADRLTAALEALDAYRRQLAKGLPIAGLEVEGKAVLVNGVPYEQLNTAQRVDIAVQVAVLRAKGSRLPVVFVDGAEALDHEHFDNLVERLKAAGVQAFLGRVEDTELEVVRD